MYGFPTYGLLIVGYISDIRYVNYKNLRWDFHGQNSTNFFIEITVSVSIPYPAQTPIQCQNHKMCLIFKKSSVYPQQLFFTFCIDCRQWWWWPNIGHSIKHLFVLLKYLMSHGLKQHWQRWQHSQHCWHSLLSPTLLTTIS